MTDSATARLFRESSVTAGDRMQVLQILVPLAADRLLPALPPVLPIGLRDRDLVLSATPRMDAQWGAACGIAIAKVAALSYDVQSDVSLRARRAQSLLLNADAGGIGGVGGWVHYLGKQVRDFLCQNNGCWTEVVREKKAYGSRVIGIAHLSSRRMRPTGDPETPALYMDRWGRLHEMRWWQCFRIVDMPEPDDISSLGYGLCAAERAYQQIKKLAAIEQYCYEKVSGSRPQAVYVLSGMQPDELNNLIRTGKSQATREGDQMFVGAIIGTTIDPTAQPGLITIPLAELPDGFQAQDERDRADLIYANAIGLDPQDLKPISHQQLGAGAQSAILHEKGKGRALVAYRQALTHLLNQLVLDAQTKFLWTERDYGDQQKLADIAAKVADTTMKLVGTPTAPGIISKDQGVQLLVDADVLPKEFIAVDTTPTERISDTDKPDAEAEAGETGADEVPPVTEETPPALPSWAGAKARPPDADTDLVQRLIRAPRVLALARRFRHAS